MNEYRQLIENIQETGGKLWIDGEILRGAHINARTAEKLRLHKQAIIAELLSVNVVNIVNMGSYYQFQREYGTPGISMLTTTESDEYTPPAKAGTDGTAPAYRWWRIHYTDSNPLEVSFCPDATHAEVLEWYPGAVAVKPFAPTIRQPLAPMTTDEESLIRAWLELINETDTATIARVLFLCQRDTDSRHYFTGCAVADLPKPDPFPDDRRTCNQCTNLVARRCQAAKHSEIRGATRSYEPNSNELHRCEGYAPGANDPDRRHGRERWPVLTYKGDTA